MTFDLRLPDGVVLSQVAAGDEVELWPEEAALLTPRSVPRRRTDVALGRTAARRALEGLGVAASAIGRGSLGQPLWPAGVVEPPELPLGHHVRMGEALTRWA